MMPFEIRFGRLVKRSMKNKLGEGGQGEVYEGFFHKMNKAVAFKYIKLTQKDIAYKRFTDESKEETHFNF